MNHIDTYVHGITHAGADLLAYDLRPVDELTALPPFTAGAHVDVHIAPGLIRQYSLCNSPAETNRYVICVHRAASGRGGSRTVHDTFRVGDRARISQPRNHFPLLPARRYLLLAGGVGVTPLAAMAEHLHSTGASLEVHVYARERCRVPLRDRLEIAPLAEYTTVHLSDKGDGLRHQPPAALRQADPETLIYACGPEGFMAAVTAHAVAAGFADEQIHTERFAPAAAAARPDTGVDGAFEVVVSSSGQRITVPPDSSIATALAANGIEVELSCEQGMCGACLTPVISGVPDHRDDVQTAAEHAANTHVTVCCSRATTPELVLDL